MLSADFCPHCKFRNARGAPRCARCRRPLQEEGAQVACRRCRFKNAATASKCLSCGAGLAVAKQSQGATPSAPRASPAPPPPPQGQRAPSPWKQTAPPARPATPGRGPLFSKAPPPSAADFEAPFAQEMAKGRQPLGRQPFGSEGPPPVDARATTRRVPRPFPPSQGAADHPTVRFTAEELKGQLQDLHRAPDQPAPPPPPQQPMPLQPPVSEVMYTEADVARATAWLCCDPFEPVPVGLKPTLSLGRGWENDMILPHESVSRTHAVVRVLGGDMTVEDRSTYGTLLNGKRIVSAKLSPGDVLGIGPYQIAVRARREAEPSDIDTRPLRIASDASPEAMQGRLEKVALAEVLQQVEFNEKTGTLKVWDDSVSGFLVVYEGKPMFAELGEERRDAEAVFAMLRLERGNFSFISKVEAGEMTMPGKTLTGLLMDFSRIQDEAGAGVED